MFASWRRPVIVLMRRHGRHGGKINASHDGAIHLRRGSAIFLRVNVQNRMQDCMQHCVRKKKEREGEKEREKEKQ